MKDPKLTPPFASYSAAEDEGMFLAPGDGRALSYSRGVDELDTLDFALLRAWHRDGVPVFAWRLYPAACVGWDALNIPAALQHVYGQTRLSDVRTLYEQARRRLCRILYNVRTDRWAHQQFQAPPLFRPLDEPPFNPLESSPENDEVMMSMVAAASQDEGAE